MSAKPKSYGWKLNKDFYMAIEGFDIVYGPTAFDFSHVISKKETTTSLPQVKPNKLTRH